MIGPSLAMKWCTDTHSRPRKARRRLKAFWFLSSWQTYFCYPQKVTFEVTGLRNLCTITLYLFWVNFFKKGSLQGESCGLVGSKDSSRSKGRRFEPRCRYIRWKCVKATQVWLIHPFWLFLDANFKWLIINCMLGSKKILKQTESYSIFSAAYKWTEVSKIMYLRLFWNMTESC